MSEDQSQSYNQRLGLRVVGVFYAISRERKVVDRRGWTSVFSVVKLVVIGGALKLLGITFIAIFAVEVSHSCKWQLFLGHEKWPSLFFLENNFVVISQNTTKLFPK